MMHPNEGGTDKISLSLMAGTVLLNIPVTFSLSTATSLVALIAGITTIAYNLIRAYKEWKK